MPLSPALEQERKLYVQLVARPAEEARAAAQKQRDAYAAKVDRLSTGPLTKWFKEELLEADTFLRYGDELSYSTVEADRQDRRKFYARAFLRARYAALRLDEEFASTGPSVLAIQNAFAWLGSAGEVVAEGAKKPVKAVLKAAGHVVDAGAGALKAVGSAASSGVTILAVGAGLALVAFAVSTGRRRGRG